MNFKWFQIYIISLILSVLRQIEMHIERSVI